MENNEQKKQKNSCGYLAGVSFLSFCVSIFFTFRQTPFYLVDDYGFAFWLGTVLVFFAYLWLLPLGIGIAIGAIIWFIDKKLLDFKRTIPYFSYVATIQLLVFGWLIWSLI